jgi:catechol 2,3-dioxygenase-like lactoylglutathione lyase family enzyme
VPQLDEAVAFFVRVIGCDLLYRTRTVFDSSGGDWMIRHFDAPANARLRTAMLRCGPTANLELLEWKIPGALLRGPTGGLGSAHLAIFVEDLERAAAHLAAEPGLRVLGSPTVATGDLHEGTEFVFALLPWGLALELVHWPPLMPYRATTAATLALPSSTWHHRP